MTRASVLALAAYLLAGCASDAVEASPTPVEIDPLPYRLVPDHGRYFVDGERLEYRVDLLFLKVATIVFETRRAGTADDPQLVVTNVSSPSGLAEALSRYGGHATTWIDEAPMTPRRYVWNSRDDPPKRRYNEYFPERNLAIGAQVQGSKWYGERFAVSRVHDPASLLVLLRVVELAADETVRLRMVEGDNERVCTLRDDGRETWKPRSDDPVPVRRISVRIDKLKDGRIGDDGPETDMVVLVSQDDRRVVLQCKGRISGRNVRIRLDNRKIPDPEPAAAPSVVAP